jgi:ATP/maltotriose-dependent transcriptional regulator MalT
LETVRQSTAVPIVCLHAPGGYGKSTLLAQWATEDDRPTVWLSVRPEAPDAGWLAQALVDELYRTGCVPERIELLRRVPTRSRGT